MSVSYLNACYDMLTEYAAERAEVDLVTNIMGYNHEAFDGILYVRTGFNSFEQWITESFEVSEYESLPLEALGLSHLLADLDEEDEDEDC